MSRVRFFDYEMYDLTDYLNRHYRGVLQPGVYFGFNCEKGTGNMDVSISMDTDPDITGAKLGTIITRDGVVIQETADLTDEVTVPNGDGANPRIDYLVADYTYNASLPNNDVSYSIVAGTPAVTPVPPTLGDDQLAIAELHIPTAFAGPLVNGTNVIDVNRKNLYADSQINLESILRNGVYTGLFVERGTVVNKITVSAGVLLTKEEKRIAESSDLTDISCYHVDTPTWTVVTKDTLSDTSNADHYRYDVVVCLHKYEDLEDNPQEYLVVEGLEKDLSAGETATLPTDANILTAATAADGKYTSADHFTKLGYIRVQGLLATPMQVEYQHYPRVLHGLSFYVSSGKIADVPNAVDYSLGPNTQIWPFTGHEGFASVLTVIQKIAEAYYGQVDTLGVRTKDFYINDQPIKLYVEGDFNIPAGVYHGIPSYVIVEGLGSAVFRYPVDANVPLTMMLGGWGEGTMVTAGATFSDKHTNQADMPTGYHRYEFFIQHGNDKIPWESLPNGLVDLNLSGHGLGIGNHPYDGLAIPDGVFLGDPVVLRQGTNEFVGWFEEHTTDEVNGAVDTDWTFRAVVPDTFVENTMVESCYIGKRRNGLKNVKIAQTGTQTANTRGALSIVGCHDAEIDQVRVPHVIAGFHKRCDIGKIHVTDYGWDSYKFSPVTAAAPDELTSYGNKYENLVFRSSLAFGLPIFFGTADLAYKNEFGSYIGRIDVDSGQVSHTYITLVNSVINQLVNKNVSGDPYLFLENCVVGCCLADSDFRINSAYSSYDKIDAGSADLIFDSGSLENVILHMTAASIVDNTAGANAHRNYIVYAGLKAADEDRNLVVGGEATFSWNSTTGVLSWDADTDIECPYFNGDNTIQAAASPVTLSADGDFLVAQLVRDTDVVVAPSVITAVNRSTIRNQDYFVIAARFGNVIHFFDGTRLEDGQSTKLGEGSTPDGSITWIKYAPSGKAYINESFRHWFGHNDAYTEDNQFILDTGDGANGYTGNDGVVDFNSAVITSSIVAGDTYVDDNGDRFWILAVDTVNDEITLHQGLSCTPGLNDFIVRGNVAFRNTALLGFTWAQTGVHAGTITFAGAPNFAGAKDGYLFRDGAGNLFPITNVAGAVITINNVYTQPDNTVTTELHGSVQTNNNPRSIELYDMKPVVGYEVVAFSDVAQMDPYGVLESKLNRTGLFTFAPIAPYDQRIRVYGTVYNAIQRSSAGMSGPLRDGIIQSGAPDISIEVTAWMTGISLVSAAGVEFFSGSTVEIIIDGESVETIAFNTHWNNNEQATTGTEVPIWGPCGWWSSSPYRAKKLTPGVHTVRLTFGGTSLAHYFAIVIINESNPVSGEYFEIPGTLYGDQGKHEISTMVKNLTLPALGDRGGKLIRYLKSSDHATRAWAHTELDTLSTTGTVTDGNVLITVASTTGFRLGDLLRIRYSAATTHPSEKVVITAINPGVSVTVTPAPSCAAGSPHASTPIQYVGGTINRLVNPTVPANSMGELTREKEQLAMVLPWFAFGTYGTLALPQEEFHNANPTTRAICGGDLHHLCLASGPVPTNLAQFLEGAGAGDEIRFSFVGTGVDALIEADTGTNITLYVDRVNVGTVDVTLAAAVTSLQDGILLRLPLCFDMEYGQHEVCLVKNTGSVSVIAFAVYEVKDPTYSGYPILSQNYQGIAITTDIGGGDLQTDQLVSEVRAVPSGFLRLPAESISGHLGNGASAAASFGVNPGFGVSLDTDSIGGRSLKWAAVPVAGAGFSPFTDITFYGDGISVDLEAGSVGNQVNVTPEFVDHDGTLKTPVTLVGTTVTGVSGVLALATGTKERYTWKMGFESLWTLRLTFAAAAATEDVFLLGAHVSRLFHISQRRETITGHSFLQPTPAGRDVRNVKVFDLIPSNGAHQAFQSSIMNTTVGEGVLHLNYYSRGEWVDVHCSGEVEDSAGWANQTITIVVRGYAAYIANTVMDLAAGVRTNISFGGSIFLPEGHHAIDVDFQSYANLSGGKIKLTATPSSFRREEIRKATLDLIPDVVQQRYP